MHVQYTRGASLFMCVCVYANIYVCVRVSVPVVGPRRWYIRGGMYVPAT
jgi:hypothetical protein